MGKWVSHNSNQSMWTDVVAAAVLIWTGMHCRRCWDGSECYVAYDASLPQDVVELVFRLLFSAS